MNVLVDDQVLGRILRGEAPVEIPPSAHRFTTGCWYVRLCQAVLGNPSHPGTLSRPFAGLPAELRHRARRALVELPDEIGLVSLWVLGPRVGELRTDHRLNLLGAEVVAAAIHLEALVVLTAASPLLTAALDHEGRTWVMVGAP